VPGLQGDFGLLSSIILIIKIITPLKIKIILIIIIIIIILLILIIIISRPHYGMEHSYWSVRGAPYKTRTC